MSFIGEPVATSPGYALGAQIEVWEVTMGMKTILVPTENDDAMRSALETALQLARRCDAYIEGFALRWDISRLVAIDGVPLAIYGQDIPEEAKQARQIFESFMREHGVPRATRTTVALSFGWLDDAPVGEDFVGSYGRVFDVIVMSRPDATSPPLHNRAIESGVFESGRPILLSPPTPTRQIATNVLIAWNCSTEQARATAFAMPLLRLADRVTVLTVIGGTGVPGPSAEQLIQHLQRNGIAAAPMSVGLDGRSTGEAILATAKSLGCDLLVKGAYTQSRLRQMIFGGATQHVMAKATMPVFLAH
jgi:nucleotide-binding universal stress UspA family protein